MSNIKEKNTKCNMKPSVEYSTCGISPHIIIFDSNWKKQLEYVHRNIDENGTKDFTLKSWKLSGGINDDVGTCTIEIEGNNAAHTLQIKPDWIIEVYLYREQERLWFTGIVVEIDTTFRPKNDSKSINVTAYGYGHTLTQRFVNISKEQYETAQGKTTTTEGISISELVKFVMYNKMTLIPPADKNITFDIEDILESVNELNENNISQDTILKQLAYITDAVYGVSPDLNFYFRLTKPQSDFIVTNKNLENHDPNTLYIIRNQPYKITDSAPYTAVIGRYRPILDDIIPDNKVTKDGFAVVTAQNAILKKTGISSEIMVDLPGKLDRKNASLLTKMVLSHVSKSRRTYDSLTVSANNNAPPLGKHVRFLESFYNDDTNPICIKYDISANDKSNLEATDMKLTLEELI